MTKKPQPRHVKVVSAIHNYLRERQINSTVRSRSYPGGSSVQVVVEDLSPASMEKLDIFCEQFRAGRASVMTGRYEYKSNRTGPTVSYVFIKNEFSRGMPQACWTWLRGIRKTMGFWTT